MQQCFVDQLLLPTLNMTCNKFIFDKTCLKEAIESLYVDVFFKK